MITDPFVECLQQRAEPRRSVGRFRHGGHPAVLEDQEFLGPDLRRGQ